MSEVTCEKNGINVGEDSVWMTRSDQSPDPLDGQVCCSAFPSANSQLFETYNLVEKSDVLDSIDDEDDIEWPETHLIIVRIRTPKPRKIIGHDSFRGFCWIPSKAEEAL